MEVDLKEYDEIIISEDKDHKIYFDRDGDISIEISFNRPFYLCGEDLKKIYNVLNERFGG